MSTLNSLVTLVIVGAIIYFLYKIYKENKSLLDFGLNIGILKKK